MKNYLEKLKEFNDYVPAKIYFPICTILILVWCMIGGTWFWGVGGFITIGLYLIAPLF